jgi:hypothetical protein
MRKVGYTKMEGISKMNIYTREKIKYLQSNARTSLMLYRVSGQVWYRVEAEKALEVAYRLLEKDKREETKVIDMSLYLNKKVA